jgi:uncharacterized cupin superfamily protein
MPSPARVPATSTTSIAPTRRFHVLEGSIHITLNDGQSVDLGPGDIATFLEGTFSHWTVLTPFKKFFIIS